MSAFFSSATVRCRRRAQQRPPQLIFRNRGCREEYHCDFSDKRVVRGPRTCIHCDLFQISQQQQVQHIVPEVTIPPEVTPENVTTYIVDSGGAALCGVSMPCPDCRYMQRAPRTEYTSRPKSAKHTLFASSTLSKIPTLSFGYLPFGYHTFDNSEST